MKGRQRSFAGRRQSDAASLVSSRRGVEATERPTVSYCRASTSSSEITTSHYIIFAGARDVTVTSLTVGYALPGKHDVDLLYSLSADDIRM